MSRLLRPILISVVVAVAAASCSKGSSDSPNPWGPDSRCGFDGYCPSDAVAVSEDHTEPAAVEVADAADAAPSPCDPAQGVLLPADSGATKFALSLFHYNVQYVAGGTKGMFDRPELDLSDEDIQDLIIVESLVPLLDALVAHPTWGMDIEMQGYMLDIMRERHPEELDKLRSLVESGQAHVDSFHWADQLWTAHPLPSMEHSWERNQAALAEACVPLGGAMFTQEGQFGHGMIRFLEGTGIVALFPSNFHKYHHGNAPVNLMYSWDSTPVMIAGRGAAEKVGDKEIEVTWHFMNDGELAFTGNLNPYFGSLFKYDPKASQKYIDKVEQLEADGWRIATIADFKAHLEAYGYQPQPLPPAVDGTWQPKDTGNHFLWMGQSGVFGDSEDDNGVLTALTSSRIGLQAAKAALGLLEGDLNAANQSRDLVYEGWTHQLLGEVSDSTGWNPWQGEVLYSLGHSSEAGSLAHQALKLAAAELDLEPLTIDTASGAIPEQLPLVHYLMSDGEIAVEFGGLEALAPDEFAPYSVMAEAPGWDVGIDWHRFAGHDGHYLITVSLIPGETAGRDVVLTFPRSVDRMSFVPALLEDEALVEDFDVSQMALDETGTLGIGLANGLLRVGDQRWLLKVTSSFHLAALIPADVQDVRFENHSAPALPTDYYFLFLDGVDATEAAALAHRVNVRPVVRFSGGE